MSAGFRNSLHSSISGLRGSSHKEGIFTKALRKGNLHGIRIKQVSVT